MLKLNLKKPLKNLAGDPILDSEKNEVLIGKVMANAVISASNTTDPTRNYLLATKLYQEKEIIFTAEELEYVKKQVREAGAIAGNIFPVLYKGQILHILEKLDKESSEDGKETPPQQNKAEKEKGAKGKK